MHDQLTHIDNQGKATMVDVSGKDPVFRRAIAQALFTAKESTIDTLLRGDLPKGEALAVARIAGIQAAKQCGDLIPLCHPLPIEHVEVEFERTEPNTIRIQSSAVIIGKTGIEMEALTAVTISALTLWDMTKAIDQTLSIHEITLLEKQKKEVV
jgi:cyclic pyranopterin phosphate synthase